MLKFRDDYDLEELEKLGFHKFVNDYYKGFCGQCLYVYSKTRTFKMTEKEPEMLEFVGELIKDGILVDMEQ